MEVQQQVVVQLQLLQGGHALGEVWREPPQLVEAQGQLLQELKGRQGLEKEMSPLFWPFEFKSPF